jgi:hypothetical protein
VELSNIVCNGQIETDIGLVNILTGIHPLGVCIRKRHKLCSMLWVLVAVLSVLVGSEIALDSCLQL